VEASAKSGDPRRFQFPRPLLNQDGCDMSFSGLKTAILRARDGVVADHGGLTRADQSDLAAGFQAAVADVLVEKTRRALEAYLALDPAKPGFAIAGGVAANATIRAGLTDLCQQKGVAFVAPPLKLCTDNAAMIAYAGQVRMQAGEVDDMNLSARPRWPLDDRAAPMLGSGKKGAKA
jgi:N6-L-threonylcarbamoyladenine synthase